MKVKEKSNYAILCLVFFIGIIVGYSKNFTKTKRFHRTHAPIGIDLHLELTYLEDSIHYILSVTDFDQKKINQIQFLYSKL